MFFTGLLITLLGLSGLIGCIVYGFNIKRMDRLGAKTPEEVKKLLIKFYSLNMFAFFVALLGIIITTVAIILNY